MVAESDDSVDNELPTADLAPRTTYSGHAPLPYAPLRGMHPIPPVDDDGGAAPPGS